MNGLSVRLRTIIIRELQVKTTMRYYFTVLTMITIKRYEITSFHVDVKKREPLHIVVGDVS